MTTIQQRLLQTIIPGKILAVQVGLTRIAVLAETDAGKRCGLAATLTNTGCEHHHCPSVRNAGHLHEMDYRDLAGLVESQSLTEVAIGFATINALLPLNNDKVAELNAEDYLIQHGNNRNVAVVGHFPFINRLQTYAKKLWVLELNPRENDLPAQAAPEIIPQADLVAMTATTLINKTFQDLMRLCKPEAKIIVVGPSTPLSPVLFEAGVSALSGTMVIDPEATLMGISQGASINQLKQVGFVKLVTMKNGNI